MKRLLGWVVLIATVVIGISYVSNHWPSGSKFGCGISGAAVAHADSAECPANLIEADSDPAWAAARIDSINAKVACNGKKYTYGEFYDVDGTEHWYASGQDSDADNAESVGRSIGVFGPVGRVASVEHVEVKVAAQMRQANVTAAVLVINNPAGPCGADEDEPGCTAVRSSSRRSSPQKLAWQCGGQAERPAQRRSRHTTEDSDDRSAGRAGS